MMKRGIGIAIAVMIGIASMVQQVRARCTDESPGYCDGADWCDLAAGEHCVGNCCVGDAGGGTPPPVGGGGGGGYTYPSCGAGTSIHIEPMISCPSIKKARSQEQAFCF